MWHFKNLCYHEKDLQADRVSILSRTCCRFIRTARLLFVFLLVLIQPFPVLCQLAPNTLNLNLKLSIPQQQSVIVQLHTLFHLFMAHLGYRYVAAASVVITHAGTSCSIRLSIDETSRFTLSLSRFACCLHRSEQYCCCRPPPG